jgi:hypothetical protein
MLNLPTLNGFSQRWAAALFARLPEWRERATADKGVLSIEVPSPIDGRSLWITTAEGDVMVCFVPTSWHEHFGAEEWRSEAESFADALELIESILNEKIAISESMNDGGSWVTTSILAGENSKQWPGKPATVYSWCGTYDREIR